MNKCFLDIETTGLTLTNAAIIEVGYLVVNEDNEVIKERVWAIRPQATEFIDYTWDAGAEAVHKISESQAMQHPIDIGEFVHLFIDAIEQDFGGDRPMVFGFNISFDFYMLKRYFDDAGLRIPLHHVLGDINMMAITILGDEFGGSRYMAPELGVEVDEEKAHRAVYDCYLALECYKALKARKDFVAGELQRAKKLYDAGDWSCKEELFDFMLGFFQAL
jgi:DNA polymerase III epsilon subunit-like protein